MATHRIPKVYLQGVDPNLRNSDVDQRLHLPILTTYFRYESSDSTTPDCYSISPGIENHPHDTLDRTMLAAYWKTDVEGKYFSRGQLQRVIISQAGEDTYWSPYVR